jgi:hypothetical protein
MSKRSTTLHQFPMCPTCTSSIPSSSNCTPWKLTHASAHCDHDYTKDKTSRCGDMYTKQGVLNHARGFAGSRGRFCSNCFSNALVVAGSGRSMSRPFRPWHARIHHTLAAHGDAWLAAFVVPVVQALVVCSPLTSPDSNSHQDLSPRGFVRSAGQSLGAVLGWHSSRTP